MGKQIFIDSEKFECYSVSFKSPIKSKISNFFSVNNGTKVISFLELFTNRSFLGKKFIKLKICDCISSTICLSPSKVH